jgi:hypothetical protein
MVGAWLVVSLVRVACAAPDEIQVYTEEMNDPGKFGVEQHLNYTIQGQQIPDYAGQMVAHHAIKATPEFSYGITKNLEAGLYVPFAFTPNGATYLNGLRFRLKYIAPREVNQSSFYGLNIEVGRDTLRVSDSLSGMEIRPIIGFHDAHWLVSFNPILNLGLAANVSHQPQFEPALKVMHSVTKEVRAGFEYYGEYGTFTQMRPSSQRGHTLYAALDVESHGLDVNIGIGRGMVNAADKWVMKAIIALPFE